MFLILGILLSLNKLSTFFLNINLSEVVTAIPWNPETIYPVLVNFCPPFLFPNGFYIFRSKDSFFT